MNGMMREETNKERERHPREEEMRWQRREAANPLPVELD